jgi:hypothetical protein
MTAKLGVREASVSAIVFCGIMFALVSIDPRVHDHVSGLFGSADVGSWSHRLGDLGNALWSAARDQSLDNAPFLVFGTVGAVLTVFMLRS